MSTDLSNARIIAWESYDGRLFVAARQNPGEKFRYDEGRPGQTAVISEDSRWPADCNLRVLEEFPKPTLADRVGDAPVFLFLANTGREAIAYRRESGVWAWNELEKPARALTCTLELIEREYILSPHLVHPLVPKAE